MRERAWNKEIIYIYTFWIVIFIKIINKKNRREAVITAISSIQSFTCAETIRNISENFTDIMDSSVIHILPDKPHNMYFPQPPFL